VYKLESINEYLFDDNIPNLYCLLKCVALISFGEFTSLGANPGFHSIGFGKKLRRDGIVTILP
jgi:hypothetical protein